MTLTKTSLLCFGVLVEFGLGVLARPMVLAGLWGGSIAPPPADLLWSRVIALAPPVTTLGDCPSPSAATAGDGASTEVMFGVCGVKPGGGTTPF